MVFDQRLRILRDGNVISPEVEAKVRRVITRFKEHWHIELTEENGSRMITHLAMALMRIEKGEEIQSPDFDILEEFREHAVFPLSQKILEDLISFTPMKLPDSEKNYIIVNICVILDTENENII